MVPETMIGRFVAPVRRRFLGADERFVKNGWLNIVGGCCGTTEHHIKAIAQMVEGKEPRKFRAQRKSWYSGIELVEATDDTVHSSLASAPTRSARARSSG